MVFQIKNIIFFNILLKNHNDCGFEETEASGMMISFQSAGNRGSYDE
jgi:hypothetical protein